MRLLDMPRLLAAVLPRPLAPIIRRTLRIYGLRRGSGRIVRSIILAAAHVYGHRPEWCYDVDCADLDGAMDWLDE